MALGGVLGAVGGGGVVGRAVVEVVGDSSKLRTELQKSKSQTLATMGKLGGALTKGLTVPILAAAGASTKLAIDYNTAFTKISAISNASAKDVAAWKGQVLDLAGTTAQAPEKLAEALFFLSSAGLKANEIMPALEASAKAASVGLGDMTDVANTTASVLNAYAGSGLKASDVTDTLVEAVKAGRAEPAEFAGALGRILPIASKAKVSFGEVAGSLAALSNIGLDVNEGVTAMRGLIQAMVAPTNKARDALKDLGLTSDDLRGILAEKGLLGTLRDLEDRTDGNIDKMSALVPNVRSLTGAFGLTQQEAKKVDDLFRQVIGSTGALDKAFKTTEQDSTFKFKQALAQLKVSAIEVGQVLVPVVTDIIEGIGKLVKKFSDLSPATKEMIVKFGLIAAAVGPVLLIFGKLFSTTGRLIGFFTKLGGAFTGVAQKANAAAAKAGTIGPAISNTAAVGQGALLVLGAAFIAASATIIATKKRVAELTAELLDGKEAWAGLNPQVKENADTIKGTALQFGVLNREGRAQAITAGNLISVQRNQRRGLGDLNDVLLDHNKTLTVGEQSSIDSALATRNFALAQVLLRREVLEAKAAIEAQGRATDALSRGAKAGLEGNEAIRRGTEKVSEAAARAKKHAEDLAAAYASLANQKPVKLNIDDSRLREVDGKLEGFVKKWRNKLQLQLNVQVREGETRVPSPGPGRTGQNPLPKGALGGILVGQAGFITRGPTMLVGESRKMTFAGKGAEAVIPFDNRGIGILAKALEKAGSGGGEAVTNLYLNVQVEHAYGDNLEQIVVGALGRAASRYGGV